MLSGFPSVGEDELAADNSDGEEQLDTTKLVQEQNRKKKKSGGFQVITHFKFKKMSLCACVSISTGTGTGT
jgi:hypothetical protein